MKLNLICVARCVKQGRGQKLVSNASLAKYKIDIVFFMFEATDNSLVVCIFPGKLRVGYSEIPAGLHNFARFYLLANSSYPI